MIKCNYGCDKRGTYQFKNGKWCCSKYISQCDGWKNKQKQRTKNWWNRLTNEEKELICNKRRTAIQKSHTTQQYKEKMSKKIKEKWNDPNHIYNDKDHQAKRRKILRKSHNTTESKLLKSNLTKKQWSDPDAKIRSSEVRKSASKSMKKVWASLSESEREAWRLKIQRWWTPKKRKLFGEEMVRRWKDPDYINTMKESRQTTPNKQEVNLQQILDNLFPNQYKFVGDLSFIVNGKNPDFISSDNTRIIELFGKYWHDKQITGLSNNAHEKERVEFFNKNGFNCLVIWETELNDLNSLAKKLTQFHGDH